MESIAVALIGSVVAPIGATASNPRSRAAIELKIDELTPHVEKHNRRIGYSHKLEQGISVIRHDLMRFCNELAWGLAITACIPVLLAAVLSRQTLVNSDCYTTNETC